MGGIGVPTGTLAGGAGAAGAATSAVSCSGCGVTSAGRAFSAFCSSAGAETVAGCGLHR
jgi:hypothetical protein